MQLLSEYALTIKYTSDTQMCDINRTRKMNNELYKQNLYCAKQLAFQNKNIIASRNNSQTSNTVNYKESCYAPVVYEHTSQQEAQGTNANVMNFLSQIKYTLNNSDIPYIDKNH